MSSTTENKNMPGETLTGTLKFDEEKRCCYIRTEDGKDIPTTPMFSFFNGFISLDELISQVEDYYNEEEVKWFLESFNAYRSGGISATVFLTSAKEKFDF
jgi:hypothetical protein